MDFGKDKITRADMEKNRSMMYARVAENNLIGGIHRIYENSEYLCFVFSCGHKDKQLLYNKITGIAKLNHLESENQPFPWTMVNGTANNNFFSVVEPYLLVNKKEGYSPDILTETNDLENIKATDNPVIFKYNFNF